ncbi:MAG: dihydrolipoyl dehydrogenase [bacterium]
MTKEIFDIVVIGAGPAGYAAAIRTAQLGFKVCLIEKDTSGLGGTCLNRGCIPTKILAGSAHLLEDIKKAQRFGIQTGGIGFEYKTLKRHKERVLKELRQGLAFVLKKNKITVKYGFGRFADKNSIEIEHESGTEVVQAHHIICATGSDPAPFPGMDGKRIIDTTHALELDELPKSMIIVGGSVSGCEFASIYKSFGVDITIIEMMDSILTLPHMEKEIIEELLSVFVRSGIKIICGVRIISAQRRGERVVVYFEERGEKKSKETDMVLIAAGRKLLTDNLNLASVGVKIGGQGEVMTDGDFRTQCDTIRAIGDISGIPMLAHRAYAQAKAVSADIKGQKHSFDLRTIPCCIFTNPPISMVGLSEDEALKAGKKVKTGVFPFEYLGIARSLDKTEGFVKIVCDQKDTVVGGHIIGHHATELIQEISLAMSKGLTVKDITHVIHPHPTFSEALLEAGENVLGEALHM